MDKNLQEVLRDLENLRPEKNLRIDGPPDDSLKIILSNFEAELKDTAEVKTDEYLQKIISKLSGLNANQATIDIFILFLCNDYAVPDKNFCYTAGVFLTAIAQLAYNQGQNNFKLDLRSLNNVLDVAARNLNSKTKRLDDLCYYLAGTPKRPLEITIHGDVGTQCCADIKYCSLKFYGSSDYNFCFGAKHSDIYVEGNLGNNCGVFAEHTNIAVVGNIGGSCFDSMKDSTAKVKGNVWECGDFAERSIITIDGDAELRCGCRAKDCTFVLLGEIGTEPKEPENERMAHGQPVPYAQDQQGMSAERTIFRAKSQATLDKLLANKSESCQYILINV
ncbi:MAG: hypothetical protein HY438_00780 [DPANN group archaeon]|nr:hypothetical protein [DPANN group archaeon]